jgi:hypothetical protein
MLPVKRGRIVLKICPNSVPYYYLNGPSRNFPSIKNCLISLHFIKFDLASISSTFFKQLLRTKHQKDSKIISLFAHLGYESVKAARRTLMKFTPDSHKNRTALVKTRFLCLCILLYFITLHLKAIQVIRDRLGEWGGDRLCVTQTFILLQKHG